MKEPPIYSNGNPGAATPPSRPSRRVRMLVKRALREQERGKRLFEKSREAIRLALQNGLKVGHPVELEIPSEDGSLTKEWFRVKNNFEGDVAFKRAYVSKYELEKVPKYQRPHQPKPEPEPSTIDSQPSTSPE